MNPLVTAGADMVWHNVKRAIGVLCVFLVIGGIVFAVWRLFNPKPTESYAQKAETINNTEHNYYPNKKVFGLGITLWGLDIGIMKYDYSKKDK